jgi:hypothetical protein
LIWRAGLPNLNFGAGSAAAAIVSGARAPSR